MAELSSSHQVLWADSRISIENFHGIEIDDFAVEVAILSLWIAKHQMNREFREKFRVEIPLIPLKETGQIKPGNATRVDWNAVCPNDGKTEIYLIGNPPYIGSTLQTVEQKRDFSATFEDRPYSKLLDYISLWFVKGANYIRQSRAQLAFVTTNSVSQGQHVEILFPMIFEKGIEIGFAYTSFKWQNNAKRNAGVTVAVISLRPISPDPKYIYTDDLRISATNINGYLADAADIIAHKRTKPLSDALPPMVFGSKPTDGGYLLLSPVERTALLDSDPTAERFIKTFLGAADYIRGEDRYCIWVDGDTAEQAAQNPEIARRFEAVRAERRASKKAATQALANAPFRFAETRYKPTESIIVPSISSGRREYIPMGYLGPDTVISNKGFAVYDASPWVFAVLTSKMHMAWTSAVSGRMREDYQYSNTIVYNNFAVPPLPAGMKEELTVAALRVLDVREYHCEQTLAELYDPAKMPQDLRDAHAAVDRLVDSIYSKKPYETDEQRLSDLFALYERMTAEEAAKVPAKKTRRSAT